MIDRNPPHCRFSFGLFRGLFRFTPGKYITGEWDENTKTDAFNADQSLKSIWSNVPQLRWSSEQDPPTMICSNSPPSLPFLFGLRPSFGNVSCVNKRFIYRRCCHFCSVRYNSNRTDIISFRRDAHKATKENKTKYIEGTNSFVIRSSRPWSRRSFLRNGCYKTTKATQTKIHEYDRDYDERKKIINKKQLLKES